METERAALVQQALAGVASLEWLGPGALAGALGGSSVALARLSAAELEAVAASLALLLDGARRLSAEESGAG